MRNLAFVFLSTCAMAQTGPAQSQTELPIDASNCAIALALGIAPPITCMNPPLGQTRGIVIHLDGEIRSAPQTQNIVVRQSKPVTPRAKPTAPPKPKVSHKAAKSENGYYIHFALNSFDLEEEYKTHLERLAKVLSSQTMANSCLRITGHTDTTGDADYNLELSKKRAVMVGAYLAEHGNIPPDRVQVAARGETNPLPEIPGHDPRNRRVEFATKDSDAGCT